MRRKLFSFAALLSLLLCVATVVLWVRSYSRLYGMTIGSVGFEFGLATTENRITLWYWDYRLSTPSRAVLDGGRLWTDGPVQDGPRSGWSNLGFGFEDNNSQVPGKSLFIPYWFIVAASTFLPAFWFQSHRGSRIADKRCWKCGYDLTGNSSGICPECGTATFEKAGT